LPLTFTSGADSVTAGIVLADLTPFLYSGVVPKAPSPTRDPVRTYYEYYGNWYGYWGYWNEVPLTSEQKAWDRAGQEAYDRAQAQR
jgi:hypothetical protein